MSREKAAVKGSDGGLRSFLLRDFHVCLAECLGNSLLADTLRDFTARTTLIALLDQSSHDAAQSCSEHVQIVQALEKGALVLAERLMQAHIGSVRATLKLQPASGDPLAELRHALSPLSGPADGTATQAETKAGAKMSNETAQDLHTSYRTNTRKTGRGLAKSTDDDSTYLGVLL